MSKSIETKVVEMQFDNSDFEKNVKTSMSTIDKLKEKLKFEDSAKGFQGITSAARNVNLSPLASAVETVNAKFTALQIVAMRVLSNITDAAMSTAKNLVNSLSIDNITSGWDRYGEKTKAVKIIMAATRDQFEDQGEQLAYINGQLEQLNWFTDETSYNYSDMVNNIAKFTNQGIALDDAVDAMQGIALWGASAGATVEQVGRAMYNISQALGTGSMMTRDWMSIENAQMATKEYKELAIAVAEDFGMVRRASDGLIYTLEGNLLDIGTFRSTLSDKWLTNDVMLETFKQYGEFSTALEDFYSFMQSGSQSYTTSELLKILDQYKNGSVEKGFMNVGKLADEAGVSVGRLTEYLSELTAEEYDLGLRAFVLGQQANTFIEVLDSVKDAASTKWSMIFEQVFGTYTEATAFWTDLSNELYDVFVEGLNEKLSVIKEWNKLGGRDLLLESFWNVFHAIIDLKNIIIDGWRSIFPPATGEQLLNITKRIRDFTEKLIISDETADKLRRTFAGVASIFKIVFIIAKRIGTAALDIVKALFNFGEGFNISILDITAKLGDFLVRIKDTVENGKVLNSIFSILSSIARTISKVIGKVISAINGHINTKSWSNTTGIISILSDIFVRLKESVSSATEWINKKIDLVPWERFGEIIGGVYNKIKDFISSIFKARDTTVEAIDEVDNKFTFSKFVQFFATVISKVREVASKIWAIIRPVLNNINHAIQSFVTSIIDSFNDGTLIPRIVNLFKAGAFGVLFVELTKWSETLRKFFQTKIDFVNSFKNVIDGFSSVFTGLSKKFKAEAISEYGSAILKFAIAIGILAASVYALSQIDSDHLWEAVGAISALITELTGVVLLINRVNNASMSLSKEGFNKSGGSGIGLAAVILAFGQAIKILAKGIKEVASLDMDALGRGLFAISSLIWEMVGVLYALSQMKVEATIRTSLMFIAFAAAITILARACRKLSDLSWDDLIRGLSGMGLMLAEMVIALNMLKGTAKEASALLILSVALNFMAIALRSLAKLSWEEIAKGLTSVAGALLAMVLSLNYMEGNAAKASALLILAVALDVVTIALKAFSKLSWEEIAKSMVTLGGALTAMVAALNFTKGTAGSAAALLILAIALDTIIPTFLVLSRMSWENLVKALTGIAVALVAFAGTLNLLAGKNVLVGASAIAILSASILTITPALIALSALSWEGLIKGLTGMALALGIFIAAAYALSPITSTVRSLSISLVLFGAGLALAGAGVLAMATGISILGLALAKSGDIIIGTLEKILYFSINAIPMLFGKLGEGLGAFINSLTGQLPIIANFVKELGLQLIDVLITLIPPLIEAIFTLIDNVLSGLVENVPKYAEYLFQLIIKVLDKLTEYMPAIIESGLKFIASIFTGLVDGLASIGIDKDKLIQGVLAFGEISVLIALIAGMVPLIPLAMIGVVGVGAVIAEIALVIAEIGKLEKIEGIDAMISNGGSILESVGNAIGSFIGGLIGGIGSAVSSALPEIGRNLSKFMDELKPFITISKTIDLSVLEGITIITSAMGEIMAIQLGQWGTSIATLFLDPIAELKAVLFGDGGGRTGFVDLMKDFATEARTFSSSDLDKIDLLSDAALRITAFVNSIPTTGGLSGLILGTKDFKSFVEGMSDFATNILEVANAANDITDETRTKIENLCDTAMKITEFADTIPNSGGVVSWFAGDNKLSDFAQQLGVFAHVLNNNLDNFSQFDESFVMNMGNLCDVAVRFAQLGNELPNSGGVVSWFAGDNTLDAFASQIVNFARGIYLNANTIESIDGSTFDNLIRIAEVIGPMAEAASKIPNQGGVVAFFAGDNTLSDFAKGIGDFAVAIIPYRLSLLGISDAIIDAMIRMADVVSVMAEAASKIPNEGGVVSWFAGDNKLSDFAKGIGEFAKSMDSYRTVTTHIGRATIDRMLNLAEVAVKFAEIANKVPAINDSVVGKIFGTDANPLVTLANGITELVTPLDTFSATVSGSEALGTDNIDDKISTVMSIVKGMAEAANELPEDFSRQSFISKVFGYQTSTDNPLVQLALGMVTLIPQVESFIEAAAGIDLTDTGIASKVGLAINIVKSMAEAANELPEDFTATDIIARLFPSPNDNPLIALGNGMAGLAPSIGTFVENLPKIDENTGTAIELAINAVKIMAEAASTLPQPDETNWQFYAGTSPTENGLIGLSNGLVAWAKAVSDGKNELSNVTKKDIVLLNAVVNMAKSFADLATGADGSEPLPTIETGWLDDVFGGTENPYVTLATGISEIAGAIAGSVSGENSIRDVTKDDLDKLTLMVDLLRNLAACAGEMNANKDTFAYGSTASSYLGDFVANFAPHILDYSEDLKDVDFARLIASENGLKAIVSVAQAVSDANLSENFWPITKDAFTTFRECLRLFYYGTYDLDPDKLTTMSNAVKEFVDIFSGLRGVSSSTLTAFTQGFVDLASVNVEGFLAVLTGSEADVSAAVNTFLGYVTRAVSSYGVIVRSQMADLSYQILIGGFADGVGPQSHTNTLYITIFNVFDYVVRQILIYLDTTYNDFYLSGKNLVDGFTKGIRDYKYLAYNAGTVLGRESLKGLNTSTQIQSPSKKAYKSGAFFGLGFTNAIIDSGESSFAAGSDLGNMAVSGLENAIKTAASLVETGINTEPTIRPILDLSNVSEGANKINSLFNRNQAYRISTGMARSSEDDSEIQNGTNSARSINFTQNNYSPKALSRMEIYRQTKNQISVMKGLVRQ